MPVTSDTLFHFTSSRNHIINILKSKFKLTYCKENCQIADTYTGDIYVPMISFCDIPLSQAKEHIDKYGFYGIGMTKNWGIKNKLNPVLYLEKNSIITNEFKPILEVAVDLVKFISDTEKSDLSMDNRTQLLNVSKKQLNNVMNLLRYIKNYEGDLIRNSKTLRNYRFYDEREWRFVPKNEYDNPDWALTQDEYNKYRGESKVKPLLESPVLDFTSSDIKYLIVKNERDIPHLIKDIKSIPNLCSSSDSTDILITKIITVDNLNYDF